MSEDPTVHCDAWKDGGEIPIAYTAAIDPNIPQADQAQPENRKPIFSFSNVPAGTRAIALVVHDVLDGEPVNGERPGWTHYTALYSPEGVLMEEGATSEDNKGWTGPYPEHRGEYHCTAYFLSEPQSEGELSRASILQEYDVSGLAHANIVGHYLNPLSTNSADST